MANAQNGQAAVSPRATIQPKLQAPPPSLQTPVPHATKPSATPSKPSAPPAAPRVPGPISVVPPSPQPPRLSSDRPRSSAPPVPPRPLGANESGAIAKHVDGSPPSSLAPSADARALVRAAVEEAVTPLRDRLDELERTMLETIVRLSGSAPAPRAPSRVEAPVTAPAPAPDNAGWEYAAGAGERRRRQVLAVLVGVIVLGVGTFFGMLAACT